MQKEGRQMYADTGSVWNNDEIAQTETDDEGDGNQVMYEISSYPSDMTLAEYYRKYNRGDLEMPNFQRNYVWSKKDASKLIESCMLGLPIPGVFLYKRRSDKKFLIVDGQQRIFSVIKFMEGSFGNQVFRLSDVREPWNNKTFKEFNEDEVRVLEDFVLRATVVQQINPENESSIYHIFERLNTGGKNLNAMEVRRCVYEGRLLAELDKLNEDAHWRLLLGKTERDNRYRDLEWILRAFAVGFDSDGYEKPMKLFLNRFLEKYRAVTDEKLISVIEKFPELTKYLYQQLGEKPFNIKGRINFAAMDSILGVFIKNIDKVWPVDLNTRFEVLKRDSGFEMAISSSTSDKTSLATRLEKVSNVFFAVS